MSDEIVAQREFFVDGTQTPCRFFRPVMEEDEAYFCYYEIGWPEGMKRRRAGGVDEVQALLLAMMAAHTDLLAARNMDGRTVTFLDDLSLGLPIADSIRDWDPGNSM